MSSHILRIAWIVAWIGLCPAGNVFSQDVPDPRSTSPQAPTPVPFRLPPDPPALVPKDNPAAKSLIADSLNQTESPADARSSGDPILDDVLEIIRRQGSVLDGSTLDPKAEDLLSDKRFPPSAAGQSESFDRDSVYRTAEQLLRSSRMLQRLPGRDRDREELIRTMRIQAAKLMIAASSAVSQEAQIKTPQASVSP